MKPVIVCGDFNVAYGELDIYRDRRIQLAGREDEKNNEKENLQALLDWGFVDSYRELFPLARDCYTWWSPKNNNRNLNRGERIDYAFVSSSIKEKISGAKIWVDINMSDHCPIELRLDAKLVGTAKLSGKHHKFSLSEQAKNKDIIISPFACADYGKFWDSLDWLEIEAYLAKKQKMIAKVAYSHDFGAIRRYQNDIVGNIYCRALAVKRVCDSNSNAGVDKVKWETSGQKMEAALNLRPEVYLPMPDRLVVMRSRSQKMRRIRIGTWADRAMQTLFRFALDPVAESWADKKSFAYRKGRSHADVCQYVKTIFSGSDAPEYVLVGDVRQCYETISHSWIMDNIPMDKRVLKHILKSGFVFGTQRYDSEEGVGIGSSLSPIIANMTLDGLQNVVTESLKGIKDDGDLNDGEVVRYADDFMVALRRKEDARIVIESIAQFLSERGLSISSSKTQLQKVSDGFDFAKMNYTKEHGYVYARPSKDSIERFAFGIQETINNFSGTQKDFIKKLNQQIGGWANHHRVGDCEAVFQQLDTLIETLLFNKCVLVHPNWKNKTITEHYWYKLPDGRRCFSLSNNREIRVNFLSDYPHTFHQKVNVTSNPYIEREYFDERLQTRDQRMITGRYRAFWEKQNGTCYYCGEPILRDQAACVQEIKLFGGQQIMTPVYVHIACTSNSIEAVDVDVLPDSEREVLSILNGIKDDIPLKGMRYVPLATFFHNTRKSSIKLSFDEVEAIIGFKLPDASSRAPFWRRSGFGYISQCWQENGYELRSLKLQERTVSWYRVSSKSSSVNIPEVFLTGHVPDKAKYELENAFKYIITKYGLQE